MIRTCLEFLGDELNAYVKRKDPTNFGNKNVSVVSSLMTPDGQLAFTNSGNDTDNDHVVITLVGLEEDRIADSQTFQYKLPNGSSQIKNPPLNLNIYLLFAVHATQYTTSLRLLSYVVSFFQSNSVFDTEKYPQLNAKVEGDKPWMKIDRITVQMHTMGFEQQNNLWAALGAKYMPNVMYKIRTMTFLDYEPKGEGPLITDISIHDN